MNDTRGGVTVNPIPSYPTHEQLMASIDRVLNRDKGQAPIPDDAVRLINNLRSELQRRPTLMTLTWDEVLVPIGDPLAISYERAKSFRIEARMPSGDTFTAIARDAKISSPGRVDFA